METRRDKNLEFKVNIQRLLNTLFLDVDAFVSDPKLLKELIEEHSLTKKELDLQYIDKEELRRRVEKTIRKLDKLIKKDGRKR